MAVSHRGATAFGMVHIPADRYTATQDNDIHFNQLISDKESAFAQSHSVCQTLPMWAVVSLPLPERRSVDVFFLSLPGAACWGTGALGQTFRSLFQQTSLGLPIWAAFLFSRANFSTTYLEAEKETALNIFSGQGLPMIQRCDQQRVCCWKEDIIRHFICEISETFQRSLL